MKSKLIISLALCSALLGCQQHSQPLAENITPNSTTSTSQSERLNQVFEDYNDAFLALNPVNALFQGRTEYNDQFGDMLSDDYLAKSLAVERQYLQAVEAFEPETLSEKDRVSYEIFVYDRKQRIDGLTNGAFRFASLLPINQMNSWVQYFPLLGSGQVLQPFNTVEDYRNWMSRAEDFARYIDIAIERMREGIEEGVVLPRILAEKTIPQLRQQVVTDITTSAFYQPLAKMPEDFSAGEKAEVTEAFKAMISNTIVPAYVKLAEFFEQEYLPATRDTDGIGHLPGGKSAYAYAIEQMTTTSMSADEIHELGLNEARRLYSEMEKVKARVGFDGDMPAFFTHLKTDPKFYFQQPEALMAGYESLRHEINPRLSRIFNIMPEADYILKAIEPFRAQSSAAAQYFPPAADGSRPGIFYVNTYDLSSRPIWMMEALSLHEASPGHHFQIAINQEAGELPTFRQFAQYNAYSEGWGLYAETLGLDMGMYQDPYQYFGMLYMQIWRANRLVVDTGLHHKGWTREQAIEFMQSNSPVTPTDVVAEVERYMVMPGQALAYMIGQKRIQALRKHASEALGNDFSLAKFHYEVLADGGMPLSILEQKIHRWIETSANHDKSH